MGYTGRSPPSLAHPKVPASRALLQQLPVGGRGRPRLTPAGAAVSHLPGRLGAGVLPPSTCLTVGASAALDRLSRPIPEVPREDREGVTYCTPLLTARLRPVRSHALSPSLLPDPCREAPRGRKPRLLLPQFWNLGAGGPERRLG